MTILSYAIPGMPQQLNYSQQCGMTRYKGISDLGPILCCVMIESDFR